MLDTTLQETIVHAVESERRPGQVLAWIGKQMCFFEREARVRPGDDVRVMFVRPVYHKDAQNFMIRDSVLALILRPVSSDHVALRHDGFKREGTRYYATCFESANREWPWEEKLIRIVPGLIPLEYERARGLVYVRKDNTHPTPRIEGVADVADLTCYPFIESRLRRY